MITIQFTPNPLNELERLGAIASGLPSSTVVAYVPVYVDIFRTALGLDETASTIPPRSRRTRVRFGMAFSELGWVTEPGRLAI